MTEFVPLVYVMSAVQVKEALTQGLLQLHHDAGRPAAVDH